MQKCNKFINIAIVHVKKVRIEFIFCIWGNVKQEQLMANSNLIDKKGVLWKIFYFFSLYKQMDNVTYYERNREKILNRAKDYYENDQERLREQVRNKYRNLSEEDEKKKREYGKNRYHNMSKEKKQELKEYRKRWYQEAKV